MKWRDFVTDPPTESVEAVVFANDIVSSWIDVVHLYVCPEYGNCMPEEINTAEDYPPIITYWFPVEDITHPPTIKGI